ncbi:hypothetical protein LTR27_006283 [Elasticomyces elasticus]|nr:hypothetical protein LTR27_006283 [Elasticomyces elasticus]
MKNVFALAAIVGLAAAASNTTALAASNSTSAIATTATVTYVVYDPECGCHKTKTAPIPSGTMAYPISTYTWWETECGCHKTAAVPMPSAPATNYTAPAQPPAVSASATPVPASPSASPVPEVYTGGAAMITSSIFGLLAAGLALALI